jgi:hypothetical protein
VTAWSIINVHPHPLRASPPMFSMWPCCTRNVGWEVHESNPVNPLETNPEKLSSQPWKSLIVFYWLFLVSDCLDSLIDLSGLLLVIFPAICCPNFSLKMAGRGLKKK